MLAVHGQGSRLSRGRHRPVRLDRQRVGIDCHHLILVFNVVVYRSLSISHRELRATSQRNALHHCSIRRIDHRRVLGVAVEHKNALRRRIVDNGVGIFLALSFAGHFQARHIENHRLGGSAVADESFAEFLHQGYSMALLQSGNRSDHGSAVRIGHLYFRTV